MKFKLTIFSLFAYVVCFAHQDFKISLNRQNIHLGYVSGWYELEINNKFKILLELTDSLFIQTKQDRIPVYFSFSHDYTKVDDEYVAIAYEKFKYFDYSSEDKNVFEGEGLVIKMRSEDLNIKKVLNLIWASIHNIELIRENQNLEIFTDKYYGEFSLMSIPKQKVETLLNEDSEEVNEVLKSKVYRNIQPENQPRNIDYFFQNNQFNFYNTRESDWEWNSEKRKREVSKTYGEVVLTLDNVVEIVGDFNYGHFVFENDSTFYYLPQLKDKVFGPIVIPEIGNYRIPFRKPKLEYKPVKRFTFVINDYKETYQKVLYVPDSALIIPHFEKLEEQFVSDLLSKKNEPEKETGKQKLNIELLCLFSLSLIALGILTFKRTQK